jgi:hypothetical protein
MCKSTITQIGLLILGTGLLSNFAFAQKKIIGVNDLGNLSYTQVKSLESVAPCEEYAKFIVYCVEDGSRVSYEFEDNTLIGIQFWTAQSTNYDAELELSALIREKKRSTGIEPTKYKGQTIFYRPGSPIIVSYGIENLNNTYFVVLYVRKTE